MQEPNVRQAKLADAETLAALGAATFTETFGHLYEPHDLSEFLAAAHSPAAARQALSDPRQALWVAEAKGRAAGYALAGPCGLPHPAVTSRCLELKRLYVLKPWQGSGLAARLMDQAMAWMSSAAPPAIFLGVWSENFRAQRFYARWGFQKVGEYEFEVGEARDLEFILRLPLADRSSS